MADTPWLHGDTSDPGLIERAVRNARPRDVGRFPKWHAVSEVFALGRTSSIALCRRFGLDPCAPVDGAHECERCAEDRE